MAKIKAPLSTHHIDIADIMRQAARFPPPTRYHIARIKESKPITPADTTSPRSTTRGAGREGEARQSDKKGETASR